MMMMMMKWSLLVSLWPALSVLAFSPARFVHGTRPSRRPPTAITTAPTATTVAVAASSSSSSSSDLSTLSVSELKRLLSERGVDFRDCLEKRDLVERLSANPPVSFENFVAPVAGSLLADETRIIDTFQRVSPSVAFITTGGSSIGRSLSLRDEPMATGSGSGFLWDAQGHVVTNAHVVLSGTRGNAVPRTVKVKLPGMVESRPARVVGVEPEKDLAVLKLIVEQKPTNGNVNNINNIYNYDNNNKEEEEEEDDLPPPLPVGTSQDLQVGQTVLAIGNPFGLDNTLTKGVVSATGRSIRGFGGRQIANCVQTDAGEFLQSAFWFVGLFVRIDPNPRFVYRNIFYRSSLRGSSFHCATCFSSRPTAINPGNSGGPLLDSSGRLIGVNTMIYSPTGTGNVGIGFAIPVDTVRRVVNQLIRYGKVVRPTLGIQVVDDRVARNVARQLGRVRLGGVLCAEVVPGSPAAAAGLVATSLRGDGSLALGDVITHVDGQPVLQVEDLLSAIEERQVGDAVQLTIDRGCDASRTDRVRVKLVSRDSLRSPATTNDKRSQQRTRGNNAGDSHAFRNGVGSPFG